MGYQEIIDGLAIDKNQARFTGTFDLDGEDLEALAMDRVAFLVVAVRVQAMNTKITSTADINRVNVLAIQDARVATGELRQEAVNFLAGKTDVPTFEFQQRNGVVDQQTKDEEVEWMRRRDAEKEAEGFPTPVGDPPPGVDSDGVVATGVEDRQLEDALELAGQQAAAATSVEGQPEAEKTELGPEDDEVEVIAAPWKAPAVAGPASSDMPIDRPKVGKFDPDAFDRPGGAANGSPTVNEVETVGSVYGRDRKDSRLAKFMESGE